MAHCTKDCLQIRFVDACLDPDHDVPADLDLDRRRDAATLVGAVGDHVDGDELGLLGRLPSDSGSPPVHRRRRQAALTGEFENAQTGACLLSEQLAPPRFG